VIKARAMPVNVDYHYRVLVVVGGVFTVPLADALDRGAYGACAGASLSG
jgi:hypothetical protein